MSMESSERRLGRKRPGMARASLLAVVLFGLIACGSPTTTEGGDGTTGAEDPVPGVTQAGGTEAGGTEAGGDESAALLAEVYEAVEGMDVDQRRETLIELAKDAGPLDLYASTNPDDAEVLLAAFTELTGIEVEHYRGNATAIRNRMLQEFEAGRPGADSVVMDGTEMAAIDGEGFLLPLESPHLEDYTESSVFGNWAAPTSNAYVATWNTDELQGDAIPSSWREVLEFDGSWAAEIADYDWFATLVKHHFVAEEGMTEEEAIALFRTGIANATPVDGHTLLVELLIAGEFDLVTSAYHHRVRSVIEEDNAPIGWNEPSAVQPVVLRPSGAAVARGADNPAAALLYVDFLLSPEGQEIYISLNRTPNSGAVEGGISSDIKTIPVDLEAATTERNKWESLYTDIINGTSQEVRGE